MVLIDVAGVGLPKRGLESLFRPPTSCLLEESSPFSQMVLYYTQLRAIQEGGQDHS